MKNRYLGPKVPQWVAQGTPGHPKWWPKDAKMVAQGTQRAPQGTKMEPKREVWVPQITLPSNLQVLPVLPFMPVLPVAS